MPDESFAPVNVPASPHGEPVRSRPPISLNGLARVTIRPEFLVILYAAVLIHAFILFGKMHRGWHGMDFSLYYTSALALRHGLNPYEIDVMRLADSINLNITATLHGNDPPTFLLCFEPLTLLSPYRAYRIWTAFNCIALALVLFLLIRGRGMSKFTILAIIGFILLYPPIAINLTVANLKVTLLLCLVSTLTCMDHGYEIGAGLSLAMAVMVGGYPLIIAGYLLCRRRWRILQATFAGLVIGGLVTLWFCGYAPLYSFMTTAMTFLNGGELIPFPADATLNAFISRQFWVFGDQPIFVLNVLRHVLVLAAQIILLGFTVRATLANANHPDYDWRAFSLWLITAVLLSPVAYIHDTVAAIPLLILLVVAASRNAASARALWLAIASYMLPALMGEIVVVLDRLGFLAHIFPLIGIAASRRLWLLLREYAFFSLILAYLSAYFFTADGAILDQLTLAGDASPTLGGNPSTPRTAI